MLRVGLTGGIGSGKSTIARIFTIFGIPVYYADDEAKRIMNENESVKAAIIKNFGSNSYTAGQLNRAHLSAQVFAEQYKLDLLNSIVHPATIHDADEWMKRQKSSYVIKEAALLFEAGAAEHLDFIIGVTAPHSIRVKRVMERDKVAREQVLKRMMNQIDEGIKMKLCDYVIVNDEQNMVMPQVLQIHGKLLAINY